MTRFTITKQSILLALLGIVSMFLFAGLEVDLSELRSGVVVITVHLAVRMLLLAVAAGLIWYMFDLNARASVLYALAIVTPSTGFILDSISSFGLVGDQRFWVKAKAIAAELLALAVLFLTIQSQSLSRLLFSALILLAVILVLPKLFRSFAKGFCPTPRIRNSRMSWWWPLLAPQ